MILSGDAASRIRTPIPQLGSRQHSCCRLGVPWKGWAVMPQMPTELQSTAGRSMHLKRGAPLVLIAAGNPVSRELREAQLRAAGLRVSVARTGFEAIVKASCQVPDVILLDDSLNDIEAEETGRLVTTWPLK